MTDKLFTVLVTRMVVSRQQAVIKVLAKDADDARRVAYLDAHTLTDAEMGPAVSYPQYATQVVK